jgi:hypothetical protein
MIVTLDFLECDDCGYTDDGSGLRAVRQYDGGKQAKGLTGILCDFCALMAERAAAAASKPRYRYRICAECDRVFDLADEMAAQEWFYGHDCEAR